MPADLKPAEAARLTMASSAAAASAASATGVNVGAHANPGSPRDDGRESLRLAQGVVLTAQGISVQHLDRLLGGELLAATPRLPWRSKARSSAGLPRRMKSEIGLAIDELANLGQPVHR